MITDRDHTIHAEHVVNAGGLWAREVGRMAGLELPVLAMEHHYLMTEPMQEVIEYNAATGRELPHMIDFAGEIYARQEGESMLLGTYEQDNRPWSPHETPWDFVFQLLAHDLDRIAPELERGFEHFPAIGRAGIKKIVNGPFTFSPDGNPLVGPIQGCAATGVACAVMAGLSQGGGVGLSLANWMVDGDPGDDIWGMDVARYGDYATLAYTNAKVRENYSRRFRITFPNEELPAARPLHTTPIYDRLTEHNAVWGAGFGLEHPLWFQRAGEEPIEDVTFRRSNAFDVVGEESRAVRERVGLSEASNFAKYKVSGDGRGRVAAGPVHQHAAEDRPHEPDRDAEPAGSHRRRVLGVARSAPTSSSCSARRPPRCTTRAGSSITCPTDQPDPVRGARAVDGRPHRRRPAVARRAAEADRHLAGDRRLPVHGVPQGRPRRWPRCGCRG